MTWLAAMIGIKQHKNRAEPRLSTDEALSMFRKRHRGDFQKILRNVALYQDLRYFSRADVPFSPQRQAARNGYADRHKAFR